MGLEEWSAENSLLAKDTFADGRPAARIQSYDRAAAFVAATSHTIHTALIYVVTN